MDRPTVEILLTSNTAKRGEKMLRAMAATHPCRVRNHYVGDCDWLMLYGAGGPDRWPAWHKHRAKGKRTVTWDIGYWDREHMLRVSVDDQHPHRWLWRMPVMPERIYPGELRDDYDHDGPVVFACMGKKSVDQHGQWDARAVAKLPPNHVIRPKPDRTLHTKLPRIETVLRGASKVVCHHSNVAIDGIIAGIPHEVVDGAALALEPTRDPVRRREFLDRLGCWQWNHREAGLAWEFLWSVPNE